MMTLEPTWATSDYYLRRAHLSVHDSDTSLCGLPVHYLYETRPPGLLTCPECAIAFANTRCGY